MRKIVAATAEHLSKLCREIEYIPSPELRGITLLVDGEPKIIVGYDGWTDGAVAMHQWIEHPRFLGRDILREAFRYIFGQAGKLVAIGVVRGDNARALEVDQKIGFEIVGRIPNGYGLNVDMWILQLHRDKCRWYRTDNAINLRPTVAAACAG